MQALQIERILNELVVDLDQELVAFQLDEPLDPTILLVLKCGIVGETIGFILLLIRLTIVVLLHLHLLLLRGCCLSLHRCRLLVQTCCVHTSQSLDFVKNY